jgi:hypothetical protein
MSRTSWLAGLNGCGLVVFFFFFSDKKIKKYYHTYKKRCVIVGIFLLSLLLMGCIGIYHIKKDSSDGRILIWKISLQTIFHHPLGVGIGNFSGSYGQEQAIYFQVGNGTEHEKYVAGNPEYGFNEYLQICIEQGIIPFILFGGIMGYCLYIGIKRKRIPATSSFLALLTIAMTSYPFRVLPFLIVLVFLLVWIHFTSSKVKENKTIINFHIPAPYFQLACIFLVFACLYNRYPSYQTYKQWEKFKTLYQNKAYESMVKEYTYLYPHLSDQLMFLSEYAQGLSKIEQYNASNEVLEKAVHIGCDPMLYNMMGQNHQALKYYEEAEKCFQKAANIIPNRIYPWYLLSNLYMEIGELEKAKETAKILLTKKPKVQSTAVREMRDKMQEIISK